MILTKILDFLWWWCKLAFVIVAVVILGFMYVAAATTEGKEGGHAAHLMGIALATVAIIKVSNLSFKPRKEVEYTEEQDYAQGNEDDYDWM